MNDQQFRRLLDFLGLSWKGYLKVRKGIKKRVARHMQEFGFQSMDSFLSTLEINLDQRKRVELLMNVPISRFFRDRKLWQIIEKRLMSQITTQEKEKVKVWSAGCASGEEVYSFKILWEEWRRGQDQLPELELWATDMNVELLDRARIGVYSPSSLKELQDAWRSRYFKPVEENRWAIADSLKEGIQWKVHNLLADDPPAEGFQIIFLRNNLLTYYKDQFMRPALDKVRESLSPAGFLIIGAHEKLPEIFTELNPFPHHPNIFQKTNF